VKSTSKKNEKRPSQAAIESDGAHDANAPGKISDGPRGATVPTSNFPVQGNGDYVKRNEQDATTAAAGESSQPFSSPSGPRGGLRQTGTVPTDSQKGAKSAKGENQSLVTSSATVWVFKRRAGQNEFIRGVEEHRLAGLLARRQYGKTTVASHVSLKKMMDRPGHTVVFGSVKVDLGREIVRKEAEAMQKAIRGLIELSKGSSGASPSLDVVDAESGRRGQKENVLNLNADDFAELYEAQRLEFRLHHSNTVYSRTKVVALTPAAVGETGDLILDEVGRVKNFREVWEAVKPIIASNPEFRCMLTTTPPPDDGHYSFELLAPPIGVEFPANPKGNWYRSELGIWVLRVDAWDAFADGVPLYDDDTGAAISPAEARARDHDKDAWDRNYGVKFVLGGTSAIGLLQLDNAQRLGIGRCKCVVIQSDEDFQDFLEWLRAKLGAGKVGIGWDVATTEKESSNPSSLTVTEREGVESIARGTAVWKTRDPAKAKFYARTIVETVNARKEGGRARRLAIDATNERYFATEVQRELGGVVPVELVIASETVEQPGKEPITRKALLGNQLVGRFDDNQIAIAPERYVKIDMRLVKRDRGSFTAEIGPNGEHGDTFDSHKLAEHALNSTEGAITSMDGMVLGERRGGRAVFTPRRLA
jgi:hypothetical protein